MSKLSDEHHPIPESHSLRLLDAFERWVDETLPKLGQAGKLAEAVRYAQQPPVFVRRCLFGWAF